MFFGIDDKYLLGWISCIIEFDMFFENIWVCLIWDIYLMYKFIGWGLCIVYFGLDLYV